MQLKPTQGVYNLESFCWDFPLVKECVTHHTGDLPVLTPVDRNSEGSELPTVLVFDTP